MYVDNDNLAPICFLIVRDYGIVSGLGVVNEINICSKGSRADLLYFSLKDLINSSV